MNHPIHPLHGVRLGPRAHAAPAWPQAEQQYAPTCYVRVPDCPLIDVGDAATTGRRMNWEIGPGWVVGWKATVFVQTAIAGINAAMWTPSDTAAQFYLTRLNINGHDQVFTDSEAPAWTRLGLIHLLGQGWVPWAVRIQPGDVWAWDHWYTGPTSRTKVRAEIALQYVSDEDLRAQVGGRSPEPDSPIMLARTLPARYMTPPSPLPVLSPGQESAARRIDFQNRDGHLVAWCGSVKSTYEYEQEDYELSGASCAGSCEVQASWHDGEHLVQNGSGPDWISFQTLFAGLGGRRWQPLCRAYTPGDQLTVRMRNINTDDPGIELQPEVIFSWVKDDESI